MLRVIIFVLLFSQLHAQSSNIQDLCNAFSNNNLFNNTSLSVSIYDLNSNQPIAGISPNKLLNPASSLKLITCLTTHNLLGADYSFTTHIYQTGDLLEDGTLQGNIVVQGGGDPTLGSPDFKGVRSMDDLLNYLVLKINDAGIKCIKGSLIIDRSIFNDDPVNINWSWDDIANYYGGGSWGFNFFENLYYLKFNNNFPINSLSKVIEIDPEVPNMKIENQVKIAGKNTGDNAYIFGGPLNYDKIVRGTIPQGSQGFTIKGALPDPGAFFKFHFAQKLKAEGIQLEESMKYKSNTANKKLICALNSPTLDRISYICLKESNNLYAESILKILGYEKNNDGSAKTGIKIINSYLNNKQLNASEYLVQDGCGLSPKNLVSSDLIASFLSNISREEDLESITKLIPKAGINGTVKNFFRNKEEAIGSVWLKSGSMSRVQSYSGYIKSKSGKMYSISVIVNAYTSSYSKVRNSISHFLNSVYLVLD